MLCLHTTITFPCSTKVHNLTIVLSICLFKLVIFQKIMKLVIFLFQGIKSNVRTSSGMFISAEERDYPMVQVSLFWCLLPFRKLEYGYIHSCLNYPSSLKMPFIFNLFVISLFECISIDQLINSLLILLHLNTIIYVLFWLLLTRFYAKLLFCCFYFLYSSHNQAIEKRISVYSQVPVENGERIQVLRWGSNLFTSNASF